MIKNNTNRVERQGNNHSSLLDEIIKIAEAKDTPKPVSTFEEDIAEILASRKNEPTLREIISQFDGGMGGLGAPAKPMDVSDNLGEAPLPDDLLSEDPALPGDEGGADIEAAKTSLAQALVDLCGSPEEAKIAIDTLLPEEGALPDVGEPVGNLTEEPAEPMMEAPAPMAAPATSAPMGM